MKNYTTSDYYYHLYFYTEDGDRHLYKVYTSKTFAIRDANKFKNWQIEELRYLSSLPF